MDMMAPFVHSVIDIVQYWKAEGLDVHDVIGFVPKLDIQHGSIIMMEVFLILVIMASKTILVTNAYRIFVTAVSAAIKFAGAKCAATHIVHTVYGWWSVHHVRSTYVRGVKH